MSKRTYRSTPEPHFANKVANLEEIVKDLLDVEVYGPEVVIDYDTDEDEDTFHRLSLKKNLIGLVIVVFDTSGTGSENIFYAIAQHSDEDNSVFYVEDYTAVTGKNEIKNIYVIKGLKNIAREGKIS